MNSASCPVDTLSIGPPQCASTPLIKRRPAAAPLQPLLSLPGPDFSHVPRAFPNASPTFFQPAFLPPVYARSYSNIQAYPLTYFPTPTYSLPLSPPGLPVFEKRCSRRCDMMTETRPLEANIPSCPAETIGLAVDKMMAQILGYASPPSPTTEFKTSLEKRLESLKSQFPTEVKELTTYLNFHSEAIEKEQQQCLKDGLFTEDFHSWLSQRYAEQLHMVFQQVEKNVLVLERQTPTNKNQSLGKEAIDTMEKWFIDHLINPYPTQEEAECMADKGGITVRQVRKWFSNKRNRARRPRSARAKHLAYECEKLLSNSCSMN